MFLSFRWWGFDSEWGRVTQRKRPRRSTPPTVVVQELPLQNSENLLSTNKRNKQTIKKSRKRSVCSFVLEVFPNYTILLLDRQTTFGGDFIYNDQRQSKMTNGAVETTVDGAAVVVERTANPQLPTTMTPPVAATASSNTSTSRSSSSSSSTQTGKKNHPIVATNTTDPATTVDATTATTPNTTTTTRSTGRTPTSFNPRASQPPLPPAQQQQPPPNTETSPTPDANDGSSNASANNNNNINNNNNNNNNNNEDWVTSTSQAFEETIARPASEALHSFFYPPVREREVTSPYRASHASIRQRDDEEDDDDDDDEGEGEEGRNHNHAGTSDQGKHRRRRRKRPNRRAPSSSAQSNGPPRGEFDEHFHQQQLADRAFVERFWTAYDDVIILSLFTQVGIVARLGVSTWFTFFDGVFSNDSPLFVNLPLNCLSCFLLGLLCSGASLMEIIMTR